MKLRTKSSTPRKRFSKAWLLRVHEEVKQYHGAVWKNYWYPCRGLYCSCYKHWQFLELSSIQGHRSLGTFLFLEASRFSLLNNISRWVTLIMWSFEKYQTRQWKCWRSLMAKWPSVSPLASTPMGLTSLLVRYVCHDLCTIEHEQLAMSPLLSESLPTDGSVWGKCNSTRCKQHCEI